MKQFSLFLFLISSFTFSSFAQDEKNDYAKPVIEKKKFDWHKIRFGGTLGAYIGRVTYIDLSPTFSYPLRDSWEVGIGPIFRYLSIQDAYTNSQGINENLEMATYGGKLLTRYFIVQGLFAQIETEIISYNYIDDYKYQKHRAVDAFPLAGAGYAQMSNSRSYFFILILLNLNETIYAPYPRNPIIRVGLSF